MISGSFLLKILALAVKKISEPEIVENMFYNIFVNKN